MLAQPLSEVAQSVRVLFDDQHDRNRIGGDLARVGGRSGLVEIPDRVGEADWREPVIKLGNANQLGLFRGFPLGRAGQCRAR